MPCALQGVRQQKCLAHVLRSLSEVSETKRGSAKAFSGWLAKLLRQALRLWTMRRAGEITEQEYRRHVERIQRELTRRLRERQLSDPDNQRLLSELGWHQDGGSLLRFLEEENVEPTNNRAERALRPAVISRKVSHCSKNLARRPGLRHLLLARSHQRPAPGALRRGHARADPGKRHAPAPAAPLVRHRPLRGLPGPSPQWSRR